MPLAKIAGRVPVVKKFKPHPIGSTPKWFITDGAPRASYLCHDGKWHEQIRLLEGYWPTEAAALAFARECAEREAGATNEGRALPDSDGTWTRVECDDRWEILVRGEWATGWHNDAPVRSSRLEEYPRGNWQPATPPAELAALRAEQPKVHWVECSNCGKIVARCEGHSPCNAEMPLLRQENSRLQAAITSAVTAKERAEGALAFYADENRYDYDETCCADKTNPGFNSWGDGILDDRGQTAREALAAARDAKGGT
jgi:hypothetical protein